VPVSALGLALAAALLHALWNLLLARSRDVLAATAASLCLSVVLFAPVAALGWRVEREALPWIAASGALELAYFFALAAAYTRADLSLVYPVARGAAPLFVLAGATAAGHTPSVAEGIGVAVVAVGIVAVRGIARGRATGLALALAIAALIAGYTLVDREGVQHAAVVPYLELITLPAAIAAAVVVGPGRLRAQLGPASVVVSLAFFGAYALVLLALRLSPAAPVAAVRETSVVIAVILAGIVLRVHLTRVRVAGAAIVAAGVALLSQS
jgi:drug/metabolite transporter (DMT)-like permease